MEISTSTSTSPLLLLRLRKFARALATGNIVIACTVLFGWGIGNEGMKTFLPGRTPMNPVVALLLILSSIAIWFVLPSEKWRRVVSGISIFVFVAALIKIMDFAGIGYGIDQVLFGERLGLIPGAPNRMAPNAALCFLLTSAALFIFARAATEYFFAAQSLCLLAAAISLQALLGYAIDARFFYAIPNFTPMALHTAICFFSLSLSLLLLNAHRGIMATLSSDHLGGVMARRVLPYTILLPMVMGWFRLLGQERGLFSVDFGASVMTTVTVVILTLIVWRNAKTLNAIDASARQNERFLESVIENIPHSIVVKNARNFKLVRVNRAVEDMMGHPREFLVGKTAYDFFPKEIADRIFRADRDVVSQAQTVDIPEDKIQTLFQGMRTLHTKKIPIYGPSGKPEFLLGISEDVTERIRMLEEVSQLNFRLASGMKELESVNKELESFSYSVSHDLRAPLRSVAGFSNILIKDYADKLDDDGKDYLLRMGQAASRMGQLIDGLLNLSRITRRELRKTKVNLSELAESVVNDLKSHFPDRRVQTSVAGNLSADGDQQLLRAVLDNLLGNACKFSSKVSEPRVEMGRTAFEEGEAFYVRDNGAGFDMAYADKLFGAFQRLHSLAEFEGTGIGLATVQRIIHKHGGRIWAESAPGQGATFYFTL